MPNLRERAKRPAGGCFYPRAVLEQGSLPDNLGIVDFHSLVLAEGVVHRFVLIGGGDDGVDLDAVFGGEGDLEGQEARGVLAHMLGLFGVELRFSIVQVLCQTCGFV